jgi:hypothetical protein
MNTTAFHWLGWCIVGAVLGWWIIGATLVVREQHKLDATGPTVVRSKCTRSYVPRPPRDAVAYTDCYTEFSDGTFHRSEGM